MKRGGKRRKEAESEDGVRIIAALFHKKGLPKKNIILMAIKMRTGYLPSRRDGRQITNGGGSNTCDDTCIAFMSQTSRVFNIRQAQC